MTKREVLMAICETPGWEPPEDDSATAEFLAELIREGWVFPRLDGYEGSPQALDAYPSFLIQADIADPESVPATEPKTASIDTVPTDRVVNFVIALLGEMPILALYRAATYVHPREPGQLISDVALSVVEAMVE